MCEPFLQIDIACPNCDGEGHYFIATGGTFWDDGSPRGYDEPCPECHGEGCIWIDPEPLTVEDLADMTEALEALANGP